MLLFLILVAVPIIEIALFIQVGGWLGLWPTLGIVILTAVIGTVMLRAQGMAALSELQRQLQVAEDPSGTLAHGAMILVSGLLLLTPGFFTDTVGLLLLIPAVRGVAIRFIRARLIVHSQVHMSAARPRGDGAYRDPGTVDGEYEVVEPDPKSSRPDRGNGSGWTQAPRSE